MAKFVFVCVSIFVFVYFLSFRVYFVCLYLYLKRICVFASFTCCSLLTSRHLPVKLTADRWESPAPFINRPRPAGRDFWPHFWIFTQFFFVFLLRMHGNIGHWPTHVQMTYTILGCWKLCVLYWPLWTDFANAVCSLQAVLAAVCYSGECEAFWQWSALQRGA